MDLGSTHCFWAISLDSANLLSKKRSMACWPSSKPCSSEISSPSTDSCFLDFDLFNLNDRGDFLHALLLFTVTASSSSTTISSRASSNTCKRNANYRKGWFRTSSRSYSITEMPRPPPDLLTRANPGPALTLPAIMTTHPWWAQMEFWQFSGNRRSSGKISLTIIDMASVTCFAPLKNQKNQDYYHHMHNSMQYSKSSVLYKGLKGSFILIHVWFQNPC